MRKQMMTTKVKICGLKTEPALDAALAGGADFVGFIFFPPSPRSLTPTPRALAARARGRARTVAVLVDPDDALLDSWCRRWRPTSSSCTEKRRPERVAEIARLYRQAVMKAISVDSRGRCRAGDSLSRRGRAHPVRRQGAARERAFPAATGITFDWHLLDGVSGAFDYMLSGGLTADNVAEAIRIAAAIRGRCFLRRRDGAGRKVTRADPPFSSRRQRRRHYASLQALEPRLSIMATTSEFSTAPTAIAPAPMSAGFFGLFGGRFVAETLMPLILELERAYDEAKRDPAFQAELDHLNTHYAGRPSPLYFAERLTEHFAGSQPGAAPRSTSSATSSTTPAATRSTTASGRSCSRGAWARRASSPRQAPASTAWRWRPCARASACPARSSWARPMSSGRNPTFSA